MVEQEERSALFLVGIACGIGAIGALWAILDTARPFMVAIGLCVVVAATILCVLNVHWKVSIHATAVSGFVAVLLCASVATETATVTMLWLLPLVPLVMWARVRTRSHTVAEVVAGAILGAAIPVSAMGGLSGAGLL